VTHTLRFVAAHTLRFVAAHIPPTRRDRNGDPAENGFITVFPPDLYSRVLTRLRILL